MFSGRGEKKKTGENNEHDENNCIHLSQIYFQSQRDFEQCSLWLVQVCCYCHYHYHGFVEGGAYEKKNVQEKLHAPSTCNIADKVLCKSATCMGFTCMESDCALQVDIGIDLTMLTTFIVLLTVF